MLILPVTGFTYQGNRVVAIGFNDPAATVASDVFYLQGGRVRRAPLGPNDRLEEHSRPA